MTLKDLIKTFDFQNPDWSLLPEDWPNCDLSGFTSAEVGRYTAIRSLWELVLPKRHNSRSRVWSDPTGYRYLVAWSNAVLLRHLVRLETNTLPRSEYKRKAQLDDAARSTVRNIEEGFKRATTSEYIDFIGFSQGSLEEVKGDIRELTEDNFLQSRHNSTLADLGINLGAFHEALKGDKGKQRMLRDSEEDIRENFVPLRVLYPPLDKVRSSDLTYEIFMELINKTDWNLRRLVESLERKLASEQKGYQLEQARIKEKFRRKK